MIGTGKIDRICRIAALLATCIALLLIGFGDQIPSEIPVEKRKLNLSGDYSETLFNDSYVHVIDLRVDDASWAYMVSHAMEEQYVLCSAEIDGETIDRIGIRPKGNSSLASISKQGSDRFSFKIEFDHYLPGHTFRGLDKLVLNNLGQDVSCMKDYLSYRMMQDMGVPGPLCAYTLLRLNGKDFGLYLAVEGIEDSFAARNYGTAWKGNLYRPDVYAIETITLGAFVDLPLEEMAQQVEQLTPGDRADVLGPIINQAFADLEPQIRISAGGYAGEAPSAYGVVFDTAVFPKKEGEQQRYIEAVRRLNTPGMEGSALDIQALSCYFAVHNFLNNYDSYTGIFAHNFYLCEREGKLSLIPWDYNLGFGAFSLESAYKSFVRGTRWYVPLTMGQAMSSDKSFVNYPIDTPLISAEMEQRPLFAGLMKAEHGAERYHRAMEELMARYFEENGFRKLVAQAETLIRPYVEQGLTFFQPQAFEAAVCEISRYGQLRGESIRGQLAGTIPATLEGQSRDPSNLIDLGDLDLGLTIDFGGLAFGITSEEVCGILEAVFAGRETNDLDRLMQDLQEDPGQIPALAGRVLSSSRLLREGILGAVWPPTLLTFCIVALVIALRRTRNGVHRKKDRKGKRHAAKA